MDRGFMEHYFEIAYNDVTGEIAGEDEQYAELQQAADEAIHALADIVGEANTPFGNNANTQSTAFMRFSCIWQNWHICVVQKIGKRC